MVLSRLSARLGFAAGIAALGASTLFMPSSSAVGALSAVDTAQGSASPPATQPMDFYPMSWLQVASGGQTTCGISTDHVGWCWGDSEEGQVGLGLHGHSASISAPNQPLDKGNTSWTVMAVGAQHACGVHTDGSLWCWGDDTDGQLGDGGSGLQDKPVAVTGGASKWTSVSAGTAHTCAIGTDHSLWCWGDNSAGQLGLGTTVSHNVPQQIAGTTWATVSAGGNHTCATQTDQSLWCWGENADGELGNGSTNNQTSPVKLKKTWASVSSGVTHTCGMQTGKSAGLVWCWGDTGVSKATKPKKVGKAKTWVSVSAGDHETCGTQSNQQIYCWGTNDSGQLGQGDTDTRTQPTEITFRLGWSTVVAGGMTTCAIRSDQGLWCWGDNTFGQTGDHAREPRYLPTTVNWSTKWLAVSRSGGSQTCAVADVVGAKNFLYCWGINDHGQLGDGTTTDAILPEHIGTALWLDVTGGEAYSCGIQTDKSLWCWGANEHGQLGIGNQTEFHTPQQVSGSQKWAQVSGGDDHTCGIDTSGGLWCWGNNANGELGIGTTTNSSVPVQLSPATGWSSVSAGVSHTCAIRTDGSVWCWGDNSHGELGDGSHTQRTTPVEVANDPGKWTWIDVGGQASCAIDTSKSLYCWGIDDHGQVGLGGGADVASPTKVDNETWYDVSVAKDHSCGSTAPLISPDLMCWGVANDGDLGDGQVTGEEDTPVRMLYQQGDPWYRAYTYDDRTCSEKAWTVCFGNNDKAQTGDGSPSDYRLMPTTIFVIPN